MWMKYCPAVYNSGRQKVNIWGYPRKLLSRHGLLEVIFYKINYFVCPVGGKLSTLVPFLPFG